MRYIYPAIFDPAEEGGYVVIIPDFDGCATEGDDLEDAVSMGAEALELAIESEIEQGHVLPRPSERLEKGLSAVSAASRVIYVSVDVHVDSLMVKTSEAAEMLGVSASRVRQMIAKEQLSGEKRGRDNYVYVWSIRKRLADGPTPGRPRHASVMQA